MRAAVLVVSVIAEIGLLAGAIVASPFVALDDRRGWTLRGRRARAAAKHRASTPVPIRDAVGERVIVEGTIELAGPPVRSPFAGGDLVWWSAYACDGGAVTWVAGEIAVLDLVDRSGRLSIGIDDPRGLPWVIGERRTIDAPPVAWARAHGRAAPEEWFFCWLEPGAQVRASGFVARDDRSGAYREPAASTSRMTEDATGVDVIVTRLDPLSPRG